MKKDFFLQRKFCEIGITVSIIPDLKPISTQRHIKELTCTVVSTPISIRAYKVIVRILLIVFEFFSYLCINWHFYTTFAVKIK